MRQSDIRNQFRVQVNVDGFRLVPLCVIEKDKWLSCVYKIHVLVQIMKNVCVKVIMSMKKN